MFLFNSVIFLKNIFLINYNFIELYEYFIIYLGIPYINYIYKLRGQNRVIDIIIYDNFNKIVIDNNYSDSDDNQYKTNSEDINYSKDNDEYKNKYKYRTKK